MATDGLDAALIAHYRERYLSMDEDELHELLSKRGLLSDEAAAALDAAAAAKGMAAPEQATRHIPERNIAEETERSRKLLRSPLSWMCQTIGITVGAVLGNALFGFIGLLVIGYAAWFGTRRLVYLVCAQGEVTISEKRWRLVALAGALFVMLMLAPTVMDSAVRNLR